MLARLRGPPNTPSEPALPLVHFTDGGGGGGHGGGGAGGAVRARPSRQCAPPPSSDDDSDDSGNHVGRDPADLSEVMFFFLAKVLFSFQTCQSL